MNGTVDWPDSTSEEVRNPNFTIPELNFNTPYEILLTVSNNSVSVNRTFILSTSGKASIDIYNLYFPLLFMHCICMYVLCVTIRHVYMHIVNVSKVELNPHLCIGVLNSENIKYV